MKVINKMIAIILLSGTGIGSVQAQDTTPQTWTLRQCIDYAIEHNIDIRQTANEAEQNKISVNTAKWARLPNLNGGVSQGWSWGRTASPKDNSYSDVNGENPEAAVLDIKGECTITCSLKAPFKGEGIISARPEQLFFDEKEGLPGKIVISTFLGDFIEYEIELDNGQTVQLNEYTKDVRELRPDGQRVKVNFDINAVGVYDARTQEVISW